MPACQHYEQYIDCLLESEDTVAPCAMVCDFLRVPKMLQPETNGIVSEAVKRLVQRR